MSDYGKGREVPHLLQPGLWFFGVSEGSDKGNEVGCRSPTYSPNQKSHVHEANRSIKSQENNNNSTQNVNH